MAPGPLLPQLDEFVAALVERYGDPGAPVVLAGNSLGGVAALRAAQGAGSRVGAVVAVSPAGFGHASWIDTAERLRVLSGMLGYLPAPLWILRQILGRTYGGMTVGQAHRRPRGSRTAYAAQFRRRSDLRRAFAGAESLLTEIRTAYDLSAIHCPVRLVWGTKDRLTLFEGAQRCLAGVAGAELVVLEGCGHCAQLEAPREIAEVLTGVGPTR